MGGRFDHWSSARTRRKVRFPAHMRCGRVAGCAWLCLRASPPPPPVHRTCIPATFHPPPRCADACCLAAGLGMGDVLLAHSSCLHHSRCERSRPARPFDPCDSTCMHLSSVYACRPRIHLLASLCSHACDSSRAQCSCCMLALAVSFYKRSDPLRYSDHSIPNSSLHSHVPKPAFNLHASMPVESKPFSLPSTEY